jgi:hypothetical protein
MSDTTSSFGDGGGEGVETPATVFGNESDSVSIAPKEDKEESEPPLVQTNGEPVSLGKTFHPSLRLYRSLRGVLTVA